MTVTHVVLLTWGTTGEAEREAVCAGVRSLPDAIPEIQSLDEGLNCSPEGLGHGYEYGFVMRFADQAARDTYLVHPVHVGVGDSIRAAAADVLVYDVES